MKALLTGIILNFNFFCKHLETNLYAIESDFYPFTPEMLNDKRLKTKDRVDFKDRLLLVLPPESINNKKESKKQINWLIHTIGKTITRHLQNIKRVPRGLSLYKMKINKYIFDESKQYDTESLNIINVDRYLNSDRRDDLSKIIRKEKKKGSKEKKGDVIFHSLKTRYFPDWKEMVNSFEELPHLNKGSVLNGPPLDSFGKALSNRPRNLQKWQNLFPRISLALLDKVGGVSEELGLEFYVLGSFLRLRKSNKNGYRSIPEINGTGERSQVEEIVELEFYLYDVTRGEIIWFHRGQLNIKGDWNDLFSTMDKMKNKLYAMYRGSLDLTRVEPGYRIYMNDFFYGKTPDVINNIPPGIYKLKLEKSGFRDKRSFIKIAQNRVYFRPSSKAKKVFLNSLLVEGREGSIGYIDGRSYGPLPLKVSNLSPGYHRLRVELAGFETMSGSFKIADSETKKLSIKLKPDESTGLDPKYNLRIYKPYRGINIFLTGNAYDIISKYFLAASVLSFASAIVIDGLGKRKVDSKIDSSEDSANPYKKYSTVFLGIGITSLVTSGVFLYISFQKDDELFPNSFIDSTKARINENRFGVLKFVESGQFMSDTRINISTGVRF